MIRALRAFVKDRPAVVAAALTGFLALGLRVYHLGHRGLWLDEIIELRCVTSTWDAMIACLRGYRNQGPLTYVADFVWHHVAGAAVRPDPDWFVRVPAVAVGLASVPLAWALANELLGRRAAWMAALLWSISPLMLDASQQVLKYSWLGFFGLSSAWCLALALRRRHLRYWVGFGVSGALAVYSHYASALILATEAAWAVLYVVAESWGVLGHQRATTRAPILRRVGSHLLGGIVSVATMATVLWPWRDALADYVVYLRQENVLIPFTSLSLSYVGDLMVWLVLGPIALWDIFWFQSPVWVITLLSVTALGGLAWAWSHARGGLLFCLAWLVTPFVALAATRGYPATPRYFFFLSIPYLLALSAGIVAALDMIHWLVRRARRSRHASPSAPPLPVSLIDAGGAVVVAALFIPAWMGYYSAPFDDWRGAAHYLRAHAGRDDLVVNMGQHSAFAQIALPYYARKLVFVDVARLDKRALDAIRTGTGRVWGAVFADPNAGEGQLRQWGGPDFAAIGFGRVTLLAPSTHGGLPTRLAAARNLLDRYRPLDPHTLSLATAALEADRLEGSNLPSPGAESPPLGGWNVGVGQVYSRDVRLTLSSKPRRD
jgi:4-amino-4-deoxy-L-arabinose transferase-like glycosyltransferase